MSLRSPAVVATSSRTTESRKIAKGAGEDGARTGSAQTLWEFTHTVTYGIPDATRLITRLEYRHDNSSPELPEQQLREPCDRYPADVGGQDTLSTNIIYTF